MVSGSCNEKLSSGRKDKGYSLWMKTQPHYYLTWSFYGVFLCCECVWGGTPLCGAQDVFLCHSVLLPQNRLFHWPGSLLLRLAGWLADLLMRPQGLSVSAFQWWDYRHMQPGLAFYMTAEDSNSGPHVYATSPLAHCAISIAPTNWILTLLELARSCFDIFCIQHHFI